MVGSPAPEVRPRNAQANRRVPTSTELAAFRAAGDPQVRRHVTGAFTGTTDEILQWAAGKWGFDPDLLRAVAFTESRWHQDFVGDGGESYGIMQVKGTTAPATYPMSERSTAFNADYYGASLRFYYDGFATWMNRQPGHVGTYAAGDLRGAIGAWYSGNWHTPAAERYIARVLDSYARRSWESAAFAADSR